MSDQIKWNGEFGEGCNLPIDCVHCDIIECGGRKSEITKLPRIKVILKLTVPPEYIVGRGVNMDALKVDLEKKVQTPPPFKFLDAKVIEIMVLNKPKKQET